MATAFVGSCIFEHFLLLFQELKKYDPHVKVTVDEELSDDEEQGGKGGGRRVSTHTLLSPHRGQHLVFHMVPNTNIEHENLMMRNRGVKGAGEG